MKNNGEVSTSTANSSSFGSFCKKLFPVGKPPLKEENKLSPCISRNPSEMEGHSSETSCNRDHLERVFSYFDENGDGKVSSAELMRCIKTIGGELSEEEAEMAVRLSDSDGDGLLGLEDFTKLMSPAATEDGEENRRREEELKEAFGMYVMKGTGYITAKSLKKMLSRLGESTTVENCRAMIRKFDLNGDGVLNFDEFRIMMTN